MAGKNRDRQREKRKMNEEKSMVEIRIMVNSAGKVSYEGPNDPIAFMKLMDLVKIDLFIKVAKNAEKQSSNIIIPQPVMPNQ